MNYIAGKLTKPAFKKGFEYLQEAYPNAALTQQAAAVATADNPMAPSEDAPFDIVAGGSPNPDDLSTSSNRTMRQRASGAVQQRAKRFALTKAIGVVWSQVTLPLTIAMWLIKLVSTWLEQRHVASALQFKSASQHQSDVARITTQIKSARTEGKMLASAKPIEQGHMLRKKESKKTLGVAAELQQRSSGSAAALALKLVDLSRLNKVISLDTSADTCVVEAGCTIRDLLRATTNSRLMPQIIPPYLDITVGGAIAGGAIGTTSWMKGAFIDQVIEMEVALGNGEVVTCSRQNAHSALFHALHSSYHSIGTILSVKIQLIHAPRYLWMRYENFTSIEKATGRITTLLSANQVPELDNLEALVFTPKNVTLCMTQGLESVDPTKHKVIQFDQWWELAFPSYVLAWSIRAQGGAHMPVKHCVPLMDYLGRYERGAFWQGNWIYSMLPWPLKGNSFISRLLCGWCLDEHNLRTSIESSSYHKEFEQGRIIQDAHVPLHHFDRYLSYLNTALRIFPLWLCPVLGSTTDSGAANFMHEGTKSNTAHGFHYVNVGVYGRARVEGEGAPATTEELCTEFLEQTYQAGGRTMLYAHNQHTPDLWSQMYDRRTYDAVREKYQAEGVYPHVYEKVKKLENAGKSLDDSPMGYPSKEVRAKVMHEVIMNKLKFWQ